MEDSFDLTLQINLITLATLSSAEARHFAKEEAGDPHLVHSPGPEQPQLFSVQQGHLEGWLKCTLLSWCGGAYL
jgi:hypothetical protein